MKVAVIGAAGQMGRWLLNHFEALGHTLVASDSRKDELRDIAEARKLILASSNVAAVKDSDVVVVSIPIGNTAEVIQEIVPHMKNNAVLCEISSVKSDLPTTLQKASESGIRPLCIHPMFGPGARSLRKKIVLIPILDLEAEDHLVETLFPNCDIIIVDAEEHDRIVALTVSLPYFVNMILTSVLADEDICLLERLGGTTFTVQLMLSGSIMSQPSTLHASLHSGNKHVPALLQKLQLKTKESIASLVDNDIVRFEQFFSEAKESLAVGVDLEKKYEEMYKLLEIMGSENEVEVSD